MSKRILLPLPVEVNSFFAKLNESVGEFCQEAVLSHMLNMVLRGFTRHDQESDSNMVDCILADLSDGGIIEDSVEGLSDAAYNTVIGEGCIAVYALGYLVRRCGITEDSVISKVEINPIAEHIIGIIE